MCRSGARFSLLSLNVYAAESNAEDDRDVLNRPGATYRRLRTPALIPMWYTTRFVSLSIGETV